MKNREAIALSVHAASTPVINGKRLAKFSGGTMLVCARRRLSLVEGEAAALPRERLVWELIAFWLIHTVSVEEVEAIGEMTDEQFAAHMKPILYDFPAAEVPAVLDYISREFEKVKASNVEIVPNPQKSTGSSPPPSVK
jgi:hypothetical protein